MAYIVFQDVESFLNLTLSTNGQVLVNSLIPSIESFAESYCNRKWSVSGNQTEYFDGGTNTFFVKYPPINTIVSVDVDTYSYQLSDVYNYGSYVKMDSRAVRGNRNVKIVYTSAIGLPADLKHALIRWVSEIFKSSSDAGKTTSRVSVGSVNVEFLTQDGIPKYVEMVLNKYRLAPM